MTLPASAPPYEIHAPAVWCISEEEDEPAFPALPLVSLRVPFYAAVGRHEKLSDKHLIELMVDLRVEMERRGIDAAEVLRKENV